MLCAASAPFMMIIPTSVANSAIIGIIDNKNEGCDDFFKLNRVNNVYIMKLKCKISELRSQNKNISLSLHRYNISSAK